MPLSRQCVHQKYQAKGCPADSTLAMLTAGPATNATVVPSHAHPAFWQAIAIAQKHAKPLAPTAVALDEIQRYTVTLHPEIQEYLGNKIKKSFKSITAFYHKCVKCNEILTDPLYVPCFWKWDISLGIANEARQSTEIVALNA